jgi:N-sulfoglucosamine sulfohydrolase
LSWEGIRNSGSGFIGRRPLKAYFNRTPEELYDLENDPAEIENLALGAKEEVKETLDNLRRPQRMIG